MSLLVEVYSSPATDASDLPVKCIGGEWCATVGYLGGGVGVKVILLFWSVCRILLFVFFLHWDILCYL